MASKHITIQHCTLCGSRYDNIAFKGGHICKKSGDHPHLSQQDVGGTRGTGGPSGPGLRTQSGEDRDGAGDGEGPSLSDGGARGEAARLLGRLPVQSHRMGKRAENRRDHERDLLSVCEGSVRIDGRRGLLPQAGFYVSSAGEADRTFRRRRGNALRRRGERAVHREFREGPRNPLHRAPRDPDGRRAERRDPQKSPSWRQSPQDVFRGCLAAPASARFVPGLFTPGIFLRPLQIQGHRRDERHRLLHARRHAAT